MIIKKENLSGGEDMKKIKFGIYLPVPTTPVDKLIKVARINEEAGFESIWAPDHLLFIPPGIVPEAWTLLTAIAMNTKRAVLGTCVTDPHRYHPAVLAQKVATVDQVSGGRVILGIGAGESMNLDPFGIEWNKPVSRLVEVVKILRKLWSGDVFDYDGEFWKMKDASLQIQPIQSRLPIYFAANSPRMLRLTGEIADGWLPLPLSPKLYKKRLDIIRDGAKESGRSIDEIEAGAYLYTAISDDAEEARGVIDSMKPVIIPSPVILKEAGYEVPDEILSVNFTQLSSAGNSSEQERYAEYINLIPTDAAMEFSIAGTTDDCIEKIDAFMDAGAEHISLINIGPDPRRVMKVYEEEIIPHFKG